MRARNSDRRKWSFPWKTIFPTRYRGPSSTRIVFTIPPRSSQVLSTPRIFIRAYPDFWYRPTIAFMSSFHISSLYCPEPVIQWNTPRPFVVICPRSTFSLNPRFPEKRTALI